MGTYEDIKYNDEESNHSITDKEEKKRGREKNNSRIKLL